MKKYLMLIFLGIVMLLASCTNETNEPSEIEETNETVETEDIEFTRYEVTFDSMGGSSVESVEVIAGNPVRKPTDPTRENFSFQGWYKTQETTLSNAWDFDIDRVNEDMTLYAGWELHEDLTTTESLTFELVNSTYAVTGVGDEADIIIPATYNGIEVTAIAEDAFFNKSIKSIILPDSISEIGLNAFYNCNQLESIYIGVNSRLSSIANNAFSGNYSLKSFYFPSSMTNLGDSAFNNCGSMEEFIIAEGNTVFSSMNGHLVLNDSMTLIRGANQEIIPEGVLTISSAAFRRSSLERIEIPSSVASIENYVFNDCESLYEIVVDENSSSYSSFSGILYNKPQTNLVHAPIGLKGNVELSPSLIEIPYAAFDGRAKIETMFIPKGTLNRIGHFSFRNTVLTILFEGSIEEWNAITKTNALWGGSGLTIQYNETKPEEETSNILVAYFSRSERTKSVAENISSKTGADLVRIIPEVAYTTNYTELLGVSQTELNSNARPNISDETYSQIDIEKYDYIFIGYPIWNGYEPMIIRSFIEHYNGLTGKTVYPFDTSASSPGNNAYLSIQGLCQNATVESYLHLNNSTFSNMDTRVTGWLEEINLDTKKLVKMSFLTYEIYIALTDNSAANDLYSRLQNGNITLSFSDFGGSEKIAYPNPSLDISNTGGYDPNIGDVTIYTPWENIAIFYSDSSDYSDNLVYVGTIEGDGVSILSSLNADFDAVLSLA